MLRAGAAMERRKVRRRAGEFRHGLIPGYIAGKPPRNVEMIRIFALLVSALIVTTAQADERFIVLSSTTSTQDSGLFEHILPIFRSATGLGVHVVAVGTARRLRSARAATPMRCWSTIASARTSSSPTALDRSPRRDVQRFRHCRTQDRSGAYPRPERRARRSCRSPAPAPCSPAAATTAAPIGWSFGCGSWPASSPTRTRPGIATSAKAWGRR